MNKKIALYGLPLLAYLVIYFPLFYTNFLYMDDAHVLWHNEKGENFNIWLVHGRFLSAPLMEIGFTSIHTINAVIIFRIISVLGWIPAICLFIKLLGKWVRFNGLDNRLVLISGVFLACNLSLAVYNGWGGSCFEVFLSFICGLLSGHLFFSELKKRASYLSIPIPMQLLILVLGVASLFIYQVGIGAFLLPFFLHFISKKFENPDRILISGVIAYLVITVVYYLLFKLTIHVYGIGADPRTTLNLDVLNKVAFFFSIPIAQAFSFNFLFSLHSIISQAFYIVAIAVWVIYSLIAYRGQAIPKKLLYIVIVFLLLILIYLPILASKDNFSAYRSMLNLNLAAFLLLINMALEWLKSDRAKTRFVIAAMLVFEVTGFYNFRINFLNPLVKEYEVLRKDIEQRYTAGITKVYFLRPPEDLFYKEFGIHYYRDEFGEPSTFKDWVPEPLVKQIIYEITGNKDTARKTEIVQFTEQEPFDKQAAQKEEHTMAIDMAAIFNNAK